MPISLAEAFVERWPHMVAVECGRTNEELVQIEEEFEAMMEKVRETFPPGGRFARGEERYKRFTI